MAKPPLEFHVVSVRMTKGLTTRDHHIAADFLDGHPAGAAENSTHWRPHGEAEALAALLRVLCDETPTPLSLRKKIAEMLDPGGQSERQLIIRFRERGAHPDPAVAEAIATTYAWHRKREVPSKTVLAEIKRIFGVGRTQALDYIKRAAQPRGSPE